MKEEINKDIKIDMMRKKKLERIIVLKIGRWFKRIGRKENEEKRRGSF